MKKLIIANILSLIWLMPILLFSCSDARKDNEIEIGVINSLTGPAGVLGKNIQNGIDMAVSEINALGGIDGKKIKLIVEDDATDSKNAVSAFNKLVNIDNVEAIIGPASSGGVMACAPIANQKKIVLLSPGAGSPNISQAGPYVFRNRVAGNLEGKKLAEFVRNNLNLETFAVFKINTDYGQGFSDVFIETFKFLGGEIAAVESFNQGATDFRTQLIKLKEIQADGIYMIGVPKECGLILKQKQELGVETPFFANNIESDELLTTAGDSANGLIYVISAYDPANSEKSQAFNSSYEKKYGKTSDMFSADGYDAVYLLKTAIERAKASKQSVRDSLSQIKDFPGVNGKITFDQNGDVIKALTIKQVKEGRFAIY